MSKAYTLSWADELDAMAARIKPVEGGCSMPEAIHRLHAQALVLAAAVILRESPS